MNFHIKDKGANRAEAWIEECIGNDWKVVCDAYLFTAENKIMVDDIVTSPEFRRQGYATKLIEKLQSTGKEVFPIGIKNKPDAQGFWKSLNMIDGLGEEM